MIGIIDYGRGNIKSVFKAFQFLGLDVKIINSGDSFDDMKALVLPGVGAFGDGMKQLESLNMIGPIQNSIKKGKPFLGICLGLQLLFEKSEESIGIDGLGVFKGLVEKFQGDYKIPHMGWNQVCFSKSDCPITKDISSGEYFYFVHSYKISLDHKNIACGTTDYFGEFVSAIHHENVTAFQFHPEKSQDMGLKLLKNWSEYAG